MTNGYHNIETANFGVPEQFIEQGSHAELLDEIGLTPLKIFRSACLRFGLNTQPASLSMGVS